MNIYTWVVVLVAVLGFAALRGLLWVERRLREIEALRGQIIQDRRDLMTAQRRIDVLIAEIAQLKTDILQMIAEDMGEEADPWRHAGDIDPWEDLPF